MSPIGSSDHGDGSAHTAHAEQNLEKMELFLPLDFTSKLGAGH